MNQKQDAPLLGYATPIPLAAQGELFRNGELFVARAGATLPQRCLLCGQPTEGRPVRLTFTWDASFLIQKSPKVEGKPVLQLRQKGDLYAYLCRRHSARFRAGRTIGGLAMGAATALMIVGLTIGVISESSVNPRLAPTGITLLVVGFAGLIVALFYFTLATRTLNCVRIEDGYLTLEGAGPAFLEQLGPKQT